MQRQENVPFLAHPSIFMSLVRYLTPASIKNLEQTSQRARNRVETFLNNPILILLLLGNYSREQSAQFFHLYRHQVGFMVNQKLNSDPDHRAAYALYLMMSRVSLEMIDLEKLTYALMYLQDNHFSSRCTQSIEFIAAFISTSTKERLHELFPEGMEFYINLRGADLSNAVLIGCDMRGANMRDACLMETDLRNADLSFSDLQAAEVTMANMENVCLIGANLSQVKEEFGFPLEPNLKSARFFSDKKLLNVQNTLNRFLHTKELPGFMLEAITKDFAKSEDQSSHAEELQRLEYGMTHPLFATHEDWLPAFCNRYLFSIFTGSQREITMEIEAIKTVLELENDGEPEQKRLK